MPTDLRTCPLPLPLAPAPTRRGITLYTVTPDHSADLARLYLVSYPPEIGATDLAAAGDEISATFRGDYGTLLTAASFIAFIGERAAGAILTVERSPWDADLDGPFIIDLFVDPALRSGGVGTTLLREASAGAARGGARTLSLRVGDGTSDAAHRLYEHLGFVAPE